MIAFTRLSLFGFSYITLFIISTIVQENFENFQEFTFLGTGILLSIWIYFIHINVETTNDFKEIIYVFTFLSFFTALASYFGLC